MHPQMEPAFDRWQEAHWFLHQLELNYHDADPLRYCMNAFIRSIKEIPQIVTTSFQNINGFKDWHTSERTKLFENELIKEIAKHRRFIVHNSMLVPKSTATMGAFRGYTNKAGFTKDVDPFQSSDTIMENIYEYMKGNVLIINLFSPNDEDQVLGVVREWHLAGIEEEILEAFRNAWLIVGKYLTEVHKNVGGEEEEITMPECFKDTKLFKHKFYPELGCKLQESIKGKILEF